LRSKYSQLPVAHGWGVKVVVLPGEFVTVSIGGCCGERLLARTRSKVMAATLAAAMTYRRVATVCAAVAVGRLWGGSLRLLRCLGALGSMLTKLLGTMDSDS
jgi:hypothetical protein